MFFLCLKIFFARIIDVSLGTVRTIYVIKGNKIIASLIAFVEIIIWFYAAREALNTDMDSFLVCISYAGGYATGTLFGTLVNEHFIEGSYTIQVISSKMTNKALKKIKDSGFGISVLNTESNKKILLLEINKKRYKECLNLIKSIDNDSFIIVNESKIAYNGYIKK